MKVTSITIQNFKPFYGSHSVSFSREEEGVILFGAKNDRGKTAFLEAVEFCLYGSTNNNSEEEKLRRCINWDSALEGEGETRVAISFIHDDTEYKIERIIEFSKADSRTDIQSKNTYVKVVIDCDNLFINTNREGDDNSAYNDFIDTILPINASHFFIFDGERIDRYARRFGRSNTEVRKAIELVLGIEELNNAISDLDKYATKFYQRRFQSANSKAEEYRSTKKKLKTANQDLAELRSLIKSKRQVLAEKKEERNITRERLANVGELQGKYKQLVETCVELHGPDTNEVSNIADYISESRIDDLTPSIETRLERAITERRRIFQRMGIIFGSIVEKNISSLLTLESPGGVKEVLRKILDERPDSCYVCGQSLEDISREDLADRLYDATSELANEARYIKKVAMALSEVSKGDRFNPGYQKSQFDHLSDRIVSLRREYSKRKSKKEELMDIVSDAEFGAQEVDEIRDRLRDLENQIELLKEEIEDLDSEISKKTEHVSQLRKTLNSLDGATEQEKKFKKLIKVSKDSRAAFSEVKDQYVELQRESVQEQTSDLFMKMTNKPSVYNGLRIGPDYQLRIETDSGIYSIDEQDPSRGARQIIAYAFIAGLARFSSRNAPILIDTPIARLDPEHKKGLLSNLPNFAEQVIVFYQPSEIDSDDLKKISNSGKILNHHDIIQEGSTSKSTIVDHNPENLI